MAYVGNQPAEKYTSLTRQTFSSPTGTSFTLDHSVTNSDDLLLYINNVKQDPADYTASGTSLTTPTLVSGDEMYALFYGRATETVNPPDSSVSSAKLANDAVTTAKIADSTVTNAKVASNAGIDISKIDESGRTAFSVYNMNTDTNATGDGTTVTIEFDSEVFDIGGDFNNTTDTFTAPATGKYLLSARVLLSSITTAADVAEFKLVTSNRTYEQEQQNINALANAQWVGEIVVLADMDASDTATVTIAIYGDSKVNTIGAGVNMHTSFYGVRLL